MTCEALSGVQLKLGPFTDNLCTRHNTPYRHDAALFSGDYVDVSSNVQVGKVGLMQPCQPGSDTHEVLLS